ncbi:MAG: PAS domain S-box protein [Bacteroidota bacterium]|nr:PAS domain S-box protein [Bacteroidota bacterium]
MNNQDYTKEELIIELHVLQQKYNSLKEAYDTAITHSEQADVHYKLEQENFSKIFATAPVGLLLLDRDTLISRINKTAVDMVLGDPVKMIGKLVGGSLGCIYSTESPKGCGFGVNCPSCRLRQGIESILAGGQSIHGTEINLTLLVGDQQQERWLKVSAEPIEINDQQLVIVAIDDITARKRMENDLIESETRFRQVINVSPVPMALNNEQQQITFLNEAFVQTFGYTKEDIPSLAHWWPLAYPDIDYRQWVVDTWAAELEQTKTTGTPFPPMELTIRCKNGTDKTVLANATSLADSFSGNHLVVLYDITDRNKAEEAMRKSEEKFRTIADFAYDWEYWKGMDNQIIYVSPSCERITGYKPEDFLSDNLLVKKIIHPGDFNLFAEHFERVHSKENMHDVEELDFRIIKKDGTVAHIGHLCRPVFSDNGKCLGRRVSNRDITDRKQAEDALRISEAHFKTIFHEAPIGIALVDSRTGNFYSANPMFAKIAGRTMEEMAQFDWISITHPDDIQEDLDNMALLNAGKISGFQMEKRYLHQDGTSVWIDMTIAPIHMEDKEHQLHLCMIMDITERKKAEHEIKLKNQELIKSISEKDKFFSIIAHDLKSPFNVFLGFTDMMVEKLPTLTLNQIQEIALSMKNSAVNVYSLLENLLEWSRMQRGLTAFDPKSFLLVPVVSETMHQILDLADKKGIDISYKDLENLKVFADENMFKSTIRNLVSNAIKFTHKGGKISLSAKVADENFIEFSISDTGIGMNKEILDKLFCLDAYTSRRGTEGEPTTGLGLMLCKEFIEKCRGKIWVESEVDRGSIFYFTLPRLAGLNEKTESKKAESENRLGIQGNDLKILIAEDDELSNELLSISVRKFGKNILKVRTGVAAVEICRKYPDVDLILMDIQMPDMDGYEATRQIRTFNTSVVIIAQTAYALDGDREKALEAGCNEYLSKPIKGDKLVELIRKYFGKV